VQYFLFDSVYKFNLLCAHDMVFLCMLREEEGTLLFDLETEENY